MTAPRKLLDPENTLPFVRLDVAKKYDLGDLIGEEIDISTTHDVVGSLNLISEMHDGLRFAHLSGIEIHEAERGKGIGLAAYILAIEMSHSRGFDFETQNYELTEYSKKVWEHLAEKAVAEIIQPFTPSPRREARFVGKYRVPVQ